MRFYIFLFLILVTFKEFEALHEECKKNSDCTNRSRCINGTCECHTLFFTYNETECLEFATSYQGSCQYDLQCEWMGKNSKCINDKCICSDNYRWFGGSCIHTSNYGKDCSGTDECFNGYDIGALKCNENKCTCANDYYLRSYEGQDCRKLSSKATGSFQCTFNIDCQQMGYKFCNLAKCVNTEENVKSNSNFADLEQNINNINKFIEMDNTLTALPSCTQDINCLDIENAVCNTTTQKCICSTGYFESDANCVKGFGYCTSECTVEHTVCYRNVCVCEKGFFLFNGECLPELGMPCKINDDCSHTYGSCKEDSKCMCNDYFSSDDTNRICTKPILQNNKNCLTDTWCRGWGPHSFCNSDNECQCNSYADFNETIQYCEKVRDIPKDMCFSNNDCKQFSSCIYGKCTCDQYFMENEFEECVPAIKASCRYDICRVNNSSCVNYACECNEGFVENDNYNECLKETTDLGGSCEINAQCKLKYTNCVNNTCQCVDSYEGINNGCYLHKDINSFCSNKKECTVFLGDDVECRKSVCQCPIKHKYVNKECISGSKLFKAELLLLLAAIGVLLSLKRM